MTTEQTTVDLRIKLDNGGGIAIESGTFSHHYSDPVHAAEDIAAILAGVDPTDWQGNEFSDGLRVFIEPYTRVFKATRLIELISMLSVCRYGANATELALALQKYL